MRQTFAAILTMLIVEAAAAATITKETIDSGGRARTFYLLAPPTEGPAPLVILLHGSGRNGKILVDHWKKLAEKEGIVLAGPDSINSRGWTFPVDGPRFLRDVVDEVKTRVPIDERRVYLFGHSAGAMFALQIAPLETTYFASVAVHAGAINASEYANLKLGERKVPFLIMVGTEDPGFPLKEVRATRDAIEAAGHPVVLREILKHNHDYYRRSASINEWAWEFLAQHALQSPQKYVEWANQ